MRWRVAAARSSACLFEYGLFQHHALSLLCDRVSLRQGVSAGRRQADRLPLQAVLITASRLFLAALLWLRVELIFKCCCNL